MLKIITKLKHGMIVTSIILLAGSLAPVSAFADGSSTTPPPCAIPQPTGPGVHKPVGSDANTYTYNCDTGMWQNGYYTFDPNSGAVTPTYSITYTYDPTTGLYNYPDWVFSAPSGSFEDVTQSTANPPAGADVVGAPAPVTPATDSGNSISNTGPNSNNSIDGSGDVGSGSISNTGPNSNNSLSGSDTNNLAAINNTNATLNNTVSQGASSGDTLVIGNTTGGDATTGDATDTANDINLLQSASSALGGNAVTFVANIDGNVNGDLLLDPSSLGTIQPSTGSSLDSGGTNNLNIDNSTGATINNNVNLDADSGNATVADNTTGGNATSGSADAIANVVNLIDSAINSGQSFVGVININGDLNGNIEVSPDLVNQLIASNVPTDTISETGPNSNNTINGSNNSTNTNITNTNNEGINNNVNATSSTGQASVADNTSAGNATSGNATNTITAFNLTGSNVVGANDLLVFVNVLGSWVGMIINAPAGATAAELGGGITQSTVGNNNTTVNNTNNDQINNNITANANSGDASVTGNTGGGNATSGNAESAVNLLNVENSNLSLSGWFGILFINVFGTWHGSFGPSDSFPALDFPPTAGVSNAPMPAAMQVFRFAPDTSSSTGTTGSSSGGGSSISNTGPGSFNAILVAKTAANGAPTPRFQSTSHKNLWFPILSVVVFVLYFVIERFHTVRSRISKKTD